MHQRLSKLTFAALAAIAIAQFAPSVASAQYYGDGYRHPPRFEDGRQRNWDRPPPRDDWGRGGCSRRDVVDAARDEGFRRIDSIDMQSRRIIVRGWNKGGPDVMAFGNRPGCPTLR